MKSIRTCALVMVGALSLVLATAAPAFANMGLPTIMLAWPAAFVLLLLIIPAEAIIISRRLLIPFDRGFQLSARANIVSTAIGIPAAWLVSLGWTLLLSLLMNPFDKLDSGRYESLFALVGGIMYPSWLMPLPPSMSGTIVTFVSLMTLQVFFFFASWIIEYRVIRKKTAGELDRQKVKRSVMVANLASYSGIELFLLVYMACAVANY